MRQHDRQRHFLGRFIAGVPHHHALVACAKLPSRPLPISFLQRAIHPRCNVRALPVQQNIQRSPSGLVSRILQYTLYDARHTRDMSAADFSRNRDVSPCRQHLTGHMGRRVVCKVVVQHAVCYNVAQFVRVPFRH